MLPSPHSLADVWRGERRDGLFFYMHVPFCEMRCGFCNLFTTANPDGDIETRYLDALERQCRETADAIGPVSIARMAIGGGTPTFLSERNLERLLKFSEAHFGATPSTIPASVETSPKTAEPSKLRILREHGVERISIGVQSFVDAEVHAAGRSQERAIVERALERIRAAGFPILNIDLMYGLPQQSESTWLFSLECALRYEPEEVYLYPLYVRPLTGMARSHQTLSDSRPELYRLAAALLKDRGYLQHSMRMFRRSDVSANANAPTYCCQSDGMIGVGCGARSYTRELHYSFEWGVGRGTVRGIIDDYIAREHFDQAHYGFVLDPEEQRRRWLIQSLLTAEGVDRNSYRERFGSDVVDDFPHLTGMDGLVTLGSHTIALTEEGLAWSDSIGPSFYSNTAQQLMESYEIR
jgi:oxygen-independent coproporphyrinogen-3 oxidase